MLHPSSKKEVYTSFVNVELQTRRRCLVGRWKMNTLKAPRRQPWKYRNTGYLFISNMRYYITAHLSAPRTVFTTNPVSVPVRPSWKAACGKHYAPCGSLREDPCTCVQHVKYRGPDKRVEADTKIKTIPVVTSQCVESSRLVG